MPDADDFDVEYFRNLLKGDSPQEGHEAPVKPARPLKKDTRRILKPSTAKEKGKPAAGRKRSANR